MAGIVLAVADQADNLGLSGAVGLCQQFDFCMYVGDRGASFALTLL